MRGQNILMFFLFTITLGSCVSLKPSPPPTDSFHLFESEALARFEQVAQVSYDLYLDLTNPQSFSGRTTLRFLVKQLGQNLRVDLAGAKVESILLNNQVVPIVYNNHYLEIPAKKLTVGPQTLTISYSAPYSREGRGLHRFVDPIDQHPYLWTQFEPFDARRLFPCFDQPDIKATYKLSVRVPKDWHVISATREEQIEVKSTDVSEWRFPPSERFSTYLFSLHAGPYAVWEDAKFRYPLRLFARKSLSQFVEPSEWFKPTRDGFAFFEEYFQQRYPYKKYDQIVVPEAGFGAMENVAAVTFHEWFISRGKDSSQRKRGRTNVILHEMAHMWFGNLVTMKWWGDLWLNETFATYMATEAAAAIAPHKQPIWQDFFGGKTGAYFEDDLSTTHPVVAAVEHTGQAIGNFDAITYGKGAALMKQLKFVLGEDQFKAGLRGYFDKFKGGNTRVDDFFAAFGETAKVDLNQWRRLWLDTKGLNEITTGLVCTDGKIKELTLEQRVANGDKVLRPHAFKLALLYSSPLKREKIIDVRLNDEFKIVSAAQGLACPQAVYPNWQDFGYFKTRLDAETIKTLTQSIYHISDPLTRQMFWQTLWTQMRDGRLSPAVISQMLVPKALEHEKNESILNYFSSMLASDHATGLLSLLWLANPQENPEWQRFTASLDQVVWSRLKQAKPHSNEQLIWLDLFSRTVSSRQGLERATQLLEKGEINGFDLDLDRQWRLVHRLAGQGAASAREWLKILAKKDSSARGVEQRLQAEAMLAGIEDKLKWVEEFKKPKSEYSLVQIQSALSGLFPLRQEFLRDQYAPTFYSQLSQIVQEKSDSAAPAFLALKPRACSQASAKSLAKYLEDKPDLPFLIRKRLKMTLEEGERCQKMLAQIQKKAR